MIFLRWLKLHLASAETQTREVDVRIIARIIVQIIARIAPSISLFVLMQSYLQHCSSTENVEYLVIPPCMHFELCFYF